MSFVPSTLLFAVLFANVHTSAINSFTLKGTGETKTYSKDTNLNEFLSQLENLAFGVCYDKEKFADCIAYDKESVGYSIDRDKSTVPQEVNAYGLYLKGKLTYDPQNITEDTERDISDPANWSFEYDSSESRRLYRFSLKTQFSEDASDELRNSMYKWHLSLLGYSGWEKFRNLNGEGFEMVCKPDEKYDLDGKEFTYMKEDAQSGRSAGFYLVNSSTGALSTPLKKLEDYGLSYNFSSYSQDSAEISPEGLSLIFEERPEAETAKDFGISIYARYGVQVEKGAYFITKTYPLFEFSNESLNEIMGEITENDLYGDKEDKIKVCLYFKYIGRDNGDGKTAERSGKLAKTGIKKAGKPIKVSVDLSKDMVVLKNGYDFSVDWDTWYTILPYNKEGTAKSPIVLTEDYTPVKKAADNLDAFTNVKVKGISIETLMSEYNGDYVIARKSAKIGSPASAVSDEGGVELYRKDTPVLLAKDTGTDYLAAADAKDTILMPSVKDAESKEAFEFIIIDKADFEAELKTPGTIDAESMKWGKYKSGGKLTVGKSKSKYKLKSEDKADNHILEEGSYVLVRKKGTKTTEKEDGWSYTWYELASDYYVAQVTKTQIEGKDTYVLSSASITVKFYIGSECRISFIVPKGGKIKKYMFPGNKFAQYEIGRDYTFLGWADTEDADTPNVDASKVYNGDEKEVNIYAVLKLKGQSSNSGENTSQGSGSDNSTGN